MRIHFWCEHFWPSIGGVEVLGAQVACALRERGHTCAVVMQQQPGDAAYEEYCGIPLHRVPGAQALSCGDPTQVRRVRAEVLQLKRAFQPDVLWLYSCDLLSFFHMSTQARVPAPVLLTLHRSYPEELLAPTTALGMVMRSTDWVTTCSDALRSWFIQRVPELGPRTSVVANALALPVLAPAPLPFDPPLLVCLGRLVAGKGFDTALDAVALLRPQYPGLRLLIAGDGAAREDLEHRVAALDLADAVTFAGWVAPMDVPALLNRATIVLMPTRIFEGFGLVALQAAQMGRPVVATRTGGLPEVVLDSQTGLLVDLDSPGALARAIAALLNDRAMARRFGQAAHLRAQTAHTWEQHITAYEHLFTQLGAASADPRRAGAHAGG